MNPSAVINVVTNYHHYLKPTHTVSNVPNITTISTET